MIFACINEETLSDRSAVLLCQPVLAGRVAGRICDPDGWDRAGQPSVRCPSLPEQDLCPSRKALGTTASYSGFLNARHSGVFVISLGLSVVQLLHVAWICCPSRSCQLGVLAKQN